MADEPQNSQHPGDAEAAVADLKSVAEQPAILSNLALANLIQNVNQAQQNAVSQQQAMNQISVAVTGKVVNLLTTLGPLEAMSAQQLLTGNAVAEEIADLKAAVGAAPAAESNAPGTGGEEEKEAAAPSKGGVTVESLSGDALATAFAVLNAVLGGKSDKKEAP